MFKDCYTEIDDFSISFSENFSIDIKCLIFSAAFLIDLNHFENCKS